MSSDAIQPAAGQISVQPDGRVVYTHGHRYPDNVQRITQIHRPDGTLQSAHITWSGFAGPVLDITATFDAAGKLLREDGYRAAGVKDTVGSFLLPLPAQAGAAQPAPSAAPVTTAPATPTIATLQELSALSGFGGTSASKVSATEPTSGNLSNPDTSDQKH